MNWLNVDLMLPQKPEFTGAKDEQRGVWFTLLAWCARVENGGIITAAASWSDEMWRQTCGVRLKNVRQTCPLWSWEGQDLTVWGYPADQERTTKQNRDDGKKGGRPKKNENPPVKPDGQTEGENPKGKERKGKEKEGNGIAPPQVEFPSGFPETSEKATSWVHSFPVTNAAEIPADWIEMLWHRVIGNGFCSGSGVRVTHWPQWAIAQWNKWGKGERLREAAAGSPQKKEGGRPDKPTVRTVVRNHPRMPEPPCDWRPVLITLYPLTAFPTAQHDLPWGEYDPEIRREVECECRRLGILSTDWTQPPVPEHLTATA